MHSFLSFLWTHSRLRTYHTHSLQRHTRPRGFAFSCPRVGTPGGPLPLLPCVRSRMRTALLEKRQPALRGQSGRSDPRRLMTLTKTSGSPRSLVACSCFFPELSELYTGMLSRTLARPAAASALSRPHCAAVAASAQVPHFRAISSSLALRKDPGEGVGEVRLLMLSFQLSRAPLTFRLSRASSLSLFTTLPIALSPGVSERPPCRRRRSAVTTPSVRAQRALQRASRVSQRA